MEHHIDDILNSLDGIKPAEAPQYFYTRLQAKLQVRQQQSTGLWLFLQLLTRPVVAVSLLGLFVVLNLVALTGVADTSSQSVNTVTNTQQQALTDFASAYSLNTTTVYNNK
jgi:hypothetical protein